MGGIVLILSDCSLDSTRRSINMVPYELLMGVNKSKKDLITALPSLSHLLRVVVKLVCIL